MKKFVQPEVHALRIGGSLSGEQLAALSDSELEAYLRENGWQEAKKRYRASEKYMLREVVGEAVLVPVDGQGGTSMITLNKSCAFLWQQLQQEKTIGDLILAAKQRFADPNGEMEADIKEFVEYRVKTGHIMGVE